MDIFKEQNMKLNFIGGGIIECQASEAKQFDTDITQIMFFTGADYFCSGNILDTVTVQIFLNNQLVLEPVKNIYLGEYANYVFYKMNLQAGHKIRVIYNNNGPNASSFRYNLMLHAEI